MPARAFFISPKSPKYLVFQARRATSSPAACSSAVARFSSSNRSDMTDSIQRKEPAAPARFTLAGAAGSKTRALAPSLLLRRGRGQILPREFDELRKRVRVIHGEVGEHLAVQFALGPLQAANQLAVAQSAGAAGSVDADDPQLAELPLAIAAIAEGELAGADQRDHRLAEQVMAAEAEALAELASPLAALSHRLAAACAGHGRNPRFLLADQPPSARMYFLAMRPVSIPALRSWRLRLVVRPASGGRRVPLEAVS